MNNLKYSFSDTEFERASTKVAIDVAAIRLEDSDLQSENADRIELVTLSKPNKLTPIRIHSSPDHRSVVAVLDFDKGRNPFIVMPHIAKVIPREVSYKRLFACINQENQVTIWAAPCAYDGRENTCATTALECAQKAMEGWVRIIFDQNKMQYDYVPARIDIEEPRWPSITFAEMVTQAYAGRLIDCLEHEKLIGLGVKSSG